MSQKTQTYSKPIPLDEPITRGDQRIDSIRVRKPGAGELRGLKLTDVVQMDVASMQILLPRITEPTLTGADVASMDPADLLNVAGEVVVFFVGKAERMDASPAA